MDSLRTIRVLFALKLGFFNSGVRKFIAHLEATVMDESCPSSAVRRSVRSGIRTTNIQTDSCLA